MARRWYQREAILAAVATVAAAVITGVFLLIATLLNRPSAPRPEDPSSISQRPSPPQVAEKAGEKPKAPDAGPSPPPSAPRRAPEQEPPAPARIVDDPRYSPLTLKQFHAGFNDTTLTRLQQDEFANRLIGRRVVWRGVIKSVDPAPTGGVTVRIHADDDPSASAFMTFGDEHRSELLRPRPGQQIEVTGVVRNVITRPFVYECKVLRIFD